MDNSLTLQSPKKKPCLTDDATEIVEWWEENFAVRIFPFLLCNAYGFLSSPFSLENGERGCVWEGTFNWIIARNTLV